MNTKTDKKIKIMRFIGMMLIAAIMLTSVAVASPNYGQNGGKWVLGNIFWVAVVVIGAIVIKLFLSGNYVKMLISAAVGGLVLVVVDDPQKLKTVGDVIWGALTSAGGA